MPNEKFTPEQDCIKKIEAYLNIKLDEYSNKRVTTMLDEFLAAKTIKPEKKTYKPTTSESIKQLRDFIAKNNLSRQLCTSEILEMEGLKICISHNIPYELFVKAPYGKSSTEVSNARKEFCKLVLKNYKTKRNQLINFFSVHHSTIILYIK